ncbi:hypothetical protein DFH07DRAFT_810749 [Mycena maculata]|uniref:Transmembrane protein n=1 Tax=Mycena maculata TaxID=230809 RepID=A0AAD7JIF3_9AGAR|nr:hypothetical protein DFH07DRAFT_810749 [Mycena maculata]
MSSYSSLSYRDASEHSENHQLSPLRHKEASESKLPVPPISRPGIGVWTPLCICGETLLVAVIGILHHFFDSYLDNRTVTGFWSQTKSNQVEIFLATVFKIVFCFSAAVSLCQVSWYSMRRQPLLLGDINALLSGPGFMTLPRLNLLFQAPAILAITFAILVSSLITIFAPSLTVRQASAVVRTLAVPTLNLTTDAVLDDFSVQYNRYGPLTSTWDKAALMGILSESPVGWSMPDGCSPECEYNITYTAPAILCRDLEPDKIDDGLQDSARYVSRNFTSPPSAYLWEYDGEVGSSDAALNFTAQDDASNTNTKYGWTLAYLPFVASNADEGTLINASGSLCTFYNATHEVKTHFYNGTQDIWVSVVDFLDPLDTSWKGTNKNTMDFYSEGGNSSNPSAGVEGVSFAPGIGAQVHLLAMADALTARLTGSITRNANTGVIASTTLLSETNIFASITSPNLQTQFPGLNVSSSVTNVTQALQQLVANATLSYVHLNTGSTAVTALVPSTENVYLYNRTTLALTYLVSFAILLVTSIIGIYCLVANREASTNDFSQLLVATRNPNLDAVAEIVEADPGLSGKAAGRTRLMFREVDVPGRGVKAAFGVASSQNVEVLRRRPSN